jgi:hypothetical protein
MSYDIYCYKSTKETPDIDEAELFVNFQDDFTHVIDPADKEKIAGALISKNNKLERFVFDYEKITQTQKITADQAKERFNHIELTSNNEKLPLQFIIADDNVTISVPYWFSEEEDIKNLFDEIKNAIDCIYRTVKYHVYDPQTEKVSLVEDFDAQSAEEKYLEGIAFINQQKAVLQKSKKKVIIWVGVLVLIALIKLFLLTR